MSDQDIVRNIESVLDQIRPNMQMDGGDIEFVEFREGTVYVRLQGACVGCPSAIYTLTLGVEDALKDQIAQVHNVALVE
jgi:Fe-S cluster biogenesis protein NfuA